MRVFIIRGRHHWWCRAVKVCDHAPGDSPSVLAAALLASATSAYSDVPFSLVKATGRVYQALRGGDVCALWEAGHVTVLGSLPRPTTDTGRRQLALSIDIEPPIPFTPETPDVQ